MAEADRVICLAAPEMLSVLKVPLFKTRVAVDALMYDKVPNVLPPPAKVLVVALVSEMMTVEEAPLNVRLVTVPVFHIVPVPVSVQVPAPIVRVRIFAFDAATAPHVTLYPFALKVPLVRVRVRADAPSMLRESWRVQVPPTPLKVIGTLIATPFVVMVADVVAEKVMEEVEDVTDIPVPRVKFP